MGRGSSNRRSSCDGSNSSSSVNDDTMNETELLQKVLQLPNTAIHVIIGSNDKVINPVRLRSYLLQVQSQLKQKKKHDQQRKEEGITQVATKIEAINIDKEKEKDHPADDAANIQKKIIKDN